MKYRISKKFHFSASHRLKHLPADHQCARLQGHNHALEVEPTGPRLNTNSFVHDYHELANPKAKIDPDFDHRHLTHVPDMPPASEHMARHFPDWHKTSTVRIRETPKIWAEYRP